MKHLLFSLIFFAFFEVKMEVNNLRFQIVFIIFLDYNNWRLHAKFQSSTIIFKTKYSEKVAKKREK